MTDFKKPSVKFLFLTFFYIGLSLFSALSSAESLYPFADIRQEAQFNHLLRELRCLVCQNQDLSDSNASLAKDLRQEVYEQVVMGKSHQEIIDYLTARYGDFILFKPPMTALTLVLWFGPLMFVLLGFIVFYRNFARRANNA